LYLILLLGERLSDLLIGLLPVPLLVAPVERKGVEENDGGVVGVLPPIGNGLQVLDQLHHLVIVLPLGVKITSFFKGTDDCCFFLINRLIFGNFLSHITAGTTLSGTNRSLRLLFNFLI
jgi:hypothetical protein